MSRQEPPGFDALPTALGSVEAPNETSSMKTQLGAWTKVTFTYAPPWPAMLRVMSWRCWKGMTGSVPALWLKVSGAPNVVPSLLKETRTLLGWVTSPGSQLLMPRVTVEKSRLTEN